MTISVRNLQTGGQRPVTRFSDNFNRALLGPNWMVSYGVVGFNGADGAALDTTVGISANALTVSRPAAGGFVNNIGIFPVQVLSNLQGKPQFSESLYLASTNLTNRMGIGVFLQEQNTKNVGGQGGYAVWQNNVAGQLQLARIDDLASLSNPFLTYTLGTDVIKISGQWNAALTAVTIRGYVNGVLQNTFVDAAPVASPTVGCPGYFCLAIVTGQTINFDDFRCGPGI